MMEKRKKGKCGSFFSNVKKIVHLIEGGIVPFDFGSGKLKWWTFSSRESQRSRPLLSQPVRLYLAICKSDVFFISNGTLGPLVFVWATRCFCWHDRFVKKSWAERKSTNTAAH